MSVQLPSLSPRFTLNPLTAVVAALGLMVFSGHLRAAVSITYANGGSSVYEPYDSVVSATDAANAGSSVLTSLTFSGTLLYGSSTTYLNDGIVFNPTTYGTGDRGNTTYSLTPSDGSQVTITFNTALSLTSVNTFAMSGSGQIRSAQDYGLEYHSGGSWTSLFSNLNTSDPNNIDAGNTTTWVNLDFSSFSGGSLAADALRFTFHNVGGDETLYREIDVVAVPEPSTWIGGTIICSMAALLYRRRRLA